MRGVINQYQTPNCTCVKSLQPPHCAVSAVGADSPTRCSSTRRSDYKQRHEYRETGVLTKDGGCSRRLLPEPLPRPRPRPPHCACVAERCCRRRCSLSHCRCWHRNLAERGKGVFWKST